MKIDPRIREQAIDALLLVGHDHINGLANLERDELSDCAWMLCKQVRTVVMEYPTLTWLDLHLECAQLLIEGWNPGDEVVALQPR